MSDKLSLEAKQTVAFPLSPELARITLQEDETFAGIFASRLGACSSLHC